MYCSPSSRSSGLLSKLLNQFHAWGSCSPSGKLNFHWRTVCLPSRIIEYVVVHELVHLHEPNHGEGFWQRLRRAMPDYRERASWLAKQGSSY
ncbi:MAG: M48 family metallopeptidase [Ardenticatenaceae bacterium]|nr:M48 family metallopeptidase [Ardenticatenaceae bacterium]MCB9446552.1 M48 family metallopeptidase [Ardenticatenaceae bacterium]